MVIRDPPPDIPRNVIPVLRRKPVTIKHELPTLKRQPKPGLASAIRAVKAERARAAANKRPPQGKSSKVPSKRTKPAAGPGLDRPSTTRRIAAEPEWTPPEILKRQLAAKKPEPRPEAPAKRAPAAAPEAPKKGETPAKLVEMRTAALTRTGLVGAACASLAFISVLLYFVLPWAVAHPANAVGPTPFSAYPDGRLDVGDLSAQNPTAYLNRLILWPLVAAFGSLIAGGVLLLIDEVARMPARRHRTLQATGLVVLVALGFIQLLAGIRWLGLYLASVLDDGPTVMQLHLEPLLILIVGALQTIGAGTVLAPKVRRFLAQNTAGRIGGEDLRAPAWTLVVIAAGLLALPLMPVATLDTTDGAAFVNEGELEASDLSATGLGDARSNEGLARGLLWLDAWMAAACLAIGLRERAKPRPALHTLFVVFFAATALPILGALAASLLAEANLAAAGETRRALALTLPLVAAGTLVVYVNFVRHTFVPFLRHVSVAMPE